MLQQFRKSKTYAIGCILDIRIILNIDVIVGRETKCTIKNWKTTYDWSRKYVMNDKSIIENVSQQLQLYVTWLWKRNLHRVMK